MNRSWGNIYLFVELMLIIFYATSTEYKSIALICFAISILRFFLKIGNGSFFLELVYLMTNITCLLMPVIGYVYFPRTNAMARLWLKYMPVSEEQYFSFIIPAIIFIGWSFFWFRKESRDDAGIINPLVIQLKKDIQSVPPGKLLVLGGISLVAYAVNDFLPAALQQVNFFLYLCFFTCIFYIFFYKNFPNKKIILLIAILFIISDSLRHAMFTIVAYMGALLSVLLLAGKKVLPRNKIALLIAGVVFVSFLQLFKVGLRKSNKSREQLSVSEIALNVISNSNDFDQVIFPIYIRMNQGFNIALVQRRIPNKVDYLGGGYLGLTFASAFVPRLFWPDKPKAGGQDNMLLYTGIYIYGWSTNVGPMGEAYGNFGHWGGWLYLFAFGFFIRYAYTLFISICKKRPILFLWMPVLFYQVVYVMETDSLQAFNSLIKGAVFLYIMYKLFPSLFPKSKS